MTADERPTSAKTTPRGAYEVGKNKPPAAMRFRKGQSGNPGGRPRATRANALVLKEVYRKVAVKDGEEVFALPAIQAILRSRDQARLCCAAMG
jgi:hypothetical protein